MANVKQNLKSAISDLQSATLSAEDSKEDAKGAKRESGKRKAEMRGCGKAGMCVIRPKSKSG